MMTVLCLLLFLIAGASAIDPGQCYYQSNVAVAVEMSSGSIEADRKILNYVTDTLLFYPGNVYNFGAANSGQTTLALVPYPNEQLVYVKSLMGYGEVYDNSSIQTVASIFEQFPENSYDISQAFNTIANLTSTGWPGYVILIATSDQMLTDSYNSIALLRGLGFGIITIVYYSNANISPLGSQYNYNFVINSTEDELVVARSVGEILNTTFCLNQMPITTTTMAPTTWGPKQLCAGQRTVFDGNVIVVFELMKGRDRSTILQFVEDTLLASDDYALGPDALTYQRHTLATLIPYPTTNSYNIYRNGNVWSTFDVSYQVEDFNSNIQVPNRDGITDALLYIHGNIPETSSSSSAIIIVGNNGSMIDPISLSVAQVLRDSFKIFTVSVGIASGNFSQLSSGYGYSFNVTGGSDREVAQQISSILVAESPGIYCPFIISSQCDHVFNGEIAVIFELAGNENSTKLTNFIKNYLYNSPIFNFESGSTEAINVPYPYSKNYKDILNYSQARNAEDLAYNIDNLVNAYNGEVDPRISYGLDLVSTFKKARKQQAVAIIVGISDMNVKETSLAKIRSAGYQTISVAIGDADFSSLAENPDWTFNVHENNQQDVVNQISEIICNL